MGTNRRRTRDPAPATPERMLVISSQVGGVVALMTGKLPTVDDFLSFVNPDRRRLRSLY